MPKLIRYPIYLYLSYLVISVALVLPALNLLAPKIVKEQTGRILRTDIIFFNPFTLALHVKNADFLEKDDRQTFVSFDKAEVNLSIESLWQPGVVLDLIAIDSLYVHAKQLQGGEFNFSDIGPEATPEPTPEATANSSSDTELPGVTVKHLNLTAETIIWTDEDREIPFSTHWDELAIKVNDLSTQIDEGQPFEFFILAESGGELHWQGSLSIPKGNSQGRLNLDNISLHPAWRYIEPWVAFNVSKGFLNLEVNYQVNWQDDISYQLSDSSLDLQKFEVIPKAGSELSDTSIILDLFHVDNISLDSTTETVGIASVDINSLAINGWSEGDEVSLVQLFATDFPAAEEEEEAAEPSPWKVELGKVALNQAMVNWQSEFTDPGTMQLSPVNFVARDIHWPLRDNASPVELNITINDTSHLNTSGEVQLESGTAAIDYELQQLPLKWFNPNLPGVLNAQIGKGSVQVKGNIALEEFAPKTVLLDGSIDDFSILVREADNALTSWQSVGWKQLAVNFDEQAVSLQQLLINQYSGRLHIHEDGTINAQHLLREEAEKQEALEEASQAEPESAEVAEKDSEEEAWSFSLPNISIADSSLDFMDESLPINFRTVIGDLNGEIENINSKGTEKAIVDLKGSVDGYAPVVFAGSANPFAEQPNLDITLSFDGVDLQPMTPYSGTYAGHAIDRGVLNLDLKYKLENSRLAGDNSIVIDQLKLGDKVESDKAVDLPLGLAIALLTDSNGVIDLKVPVSGDVNDPDFSLGGVIFGALVNIITKAVTAPFNLLAGLVSSSEDLQRVTFSAGSAELNEQAKKNLLDLAHALQQRPGLKLGITGRFHPTADVDKMQRNQFNAKLMKQGLTAEDISTKNEAWIDMVAKEYQAIASNAETELTTQQQLKAILANITISQQQLLQLARDRAAEAKRFLVNEAQLAPDHAFLNNIEFADEKNKFSGVEMAIDA